MDLIQELYAMLSGPASNMPPVPVRNPGGVPPLPLPNPGRGGPSDFSIPNVHQNFDASGNFNGGGVPLPTRRPEPAPPPLPTRPPGQDGQVQLAELVRNMLASAGGKAQAAVAPGAQPGVGNTPSMPPPPMRRPQPSLPPLPARRPDPASPAGSEALDVVLSWLRENVWNGGVNPAAAQPAAAGGPSMPPLPTRPPAATGPAAPGNAGANPDPRSAAWLAWAGQSPRKAQPQAPSLPTGQPGAPQLPVRRPGAPQLPGTVVDNNVPGDMLGELEQAFGGVPIATGLTPVRAIADADGPAQGTPQPGQSAPRPLPTVTGAAPGRDQIGPFETTVTPAGPNITGKDVAAFFRSLARGAASADPTAPGFTAFAQGMSGAMDSRRQEQLGDEKARLAADDREFERRMKTSENRRAEARDQRESRRAEIENTKAVTDIMRSLGGSLSTDQKFKFEKQITDYAKAINPDGMMDADQLKAALDEYRTDLEQRMGVSRAQPGGGQKAPARGGDGRSRESPAQPTDQASFAALPSGAWFINPADGRILQKK